MVRLEKSGLCILVTATLLAMGGLVEAQEAELPQDWNKLNISQLNQVAQSLMKKGDATKDERRRFVAFLSDKFLGKPEAVAQVNGSRANREDTLSGWGDLLKTVRGELSESQRTEWCQTLKSAYVVSPMWYWQCTNSPTHVRSWIRTKGEKLQPNGY